MVRFRHRSSRHLSRNRPSHPPWEIEGRCHVTILPLPVVAVAASDLKVGVSRRKTFSFYQLEVDPPVDTHSHPEVCLDTRSEGAAAPLPAETRILCYAEGVRD